MLRLKKLGENFKNPYNIGDKIEFFTSKNIWIEGLIIDFLVTDYYYKAVIKCKNNYCKFHYVCICSLYLRKC